MTDKYLLLLTDCKVWMLGVSLRQGWGRRVELAVDGLDEFKRKETYRDGLLIALFRTLCNFVKGPTGRSCKRRCPQKSK